MSYQSFTHLYPLSNKTLRFELKPIGKTIDNITINGLLDQDQHRAESYVQVKTIIDEYHKAFIETILEDFKFNNNSGKKDSLEEFYTCYMCKSKEESQRKLFEEIQNKLRKQIADSFAKEERFKRIDKKELIREDLVNFVTCHEDQVLINEFRDFTTYFTGFHENRKNMYSAESKSTAIAYRLIHENLPRFIDNMMIFDKVAASPIAQQFAELYTKFEEYLNVMDIAEMFQLGYFNVVLTQKQIDVYNIIIGDLNQRVNLYNQQQKDKSSRLPKLKPLYKQILSDRNAIYWLPKQFDSDEEVLEAIQKAYHELDEQVLNRKKEGEHSLKELLQTLGEYDLDKIYIRNDLQLTDISQKVFGNWGVIHKALLEALKQVVSKKSRKETDEAYEERLDKILKSQGSISIAQINKSVQSLNIENEANLQSYYSLLGAVNNEICQKENLFSQIENAYNDVKDLLNTPYSGSNLAQDKQNVEKLKNLLDAIKSLQHYVKPLLGDATEPEKDEKFYGEFTALWGELDKITPLYNMVRNYMTRKPYSTEKIKLNFENSTLMDGWDLNKEQANTTVILRKEGLYYLAIMNKKHNKVFDVANMPTGGDCYEKMEYKQIADAGKDIQNIIYHDGKYQRFTKKLDRLKEENIPQIYRIREKGSYLQDAPKSDVKKFSKEDLSTFIEYYKDAAIHYWDWCEFSFKKSEDYANWKEFTDHVNMQGYKISFRNVSVDYIHSLVEDGKIYLFQIYNKDFSPYSKGTPNLHTLYWKMLFDERNLADVVYKLNGEAEVFFRKSSIICERPTHPANQAIDNKNVLNKKKQSVFKYDLIKDRRYTVDKFQFHVPITMNFKCTGGDNINQSVNEYIQKCDDLHIIGIDRGERHLLYLTVIDMKGQIKEQYSLNEIVNTYKGNEYRTNYHELLSKREDERMKARQSWQTIENIKELKEGYLSQVIHKISELMVKYNAIVVLEDLNMGFMRGRQKVESSVYQKFEKMLIDKLNYLVDKTKNPEEDGGVLNAYQLTNKFTSFQKMGKQSGFLFYTQAWNTSKIDPVTGFVNLFDTRYETREKAKVFFCKFDSIRYNRDKDWFEFVFDYNNFTTKAEGTRTKWTLCTFGKRIETFRDATQNSQWVSKECDLTEKFKEFFENYAINIHANLKEKIVQQDSAEFFKGLLYLLKLTLQMRNSEAGTVKDYLQSPVADEQGNFYNSELCDASLPENADANGAYNIARKGLWIVHQIKASDDLKNVKLAISNKEWLQFAQNKPYLND